MNEICQHAGCGRQIAEADLRGCWRCGRKGRPTDAALLDAIKRPPRERDDGVLIGTPTGRSGPIAQPASLPSADGFGNLDHGETPRSEWPAVLQDDQDLADAWAEYQAHGLWDPATRTGIGPIALQQLRAAGAPIEEMS